VTFNDPWGHSSSYKNVFISNVIYKKILFSDMKMTLCDLQGHLRSISYHGKFASLYCYHSYKVLITSDLDKKKVTWGKDGVFLRDVKEIWVLIILLCRRSFKSNCIMKSIKFDWKYEDMNILTRYWIEADCTEHTAAVKQAAHTYSITQTVFFKIRWYLIFEFQHISWKNVVSTSWHLHNFPSAKHYISILKYSLFKNVSSSTSHKKKSVFILLHLKLLLLIV
jgi:hypothetical protein